MKKNKDFEVDEKSILLKTIKLTKNINYLTERLPKPNYSPLRLKSINNHKSALSQRYVSKSPYDLHMSLPPIKSQNRGSLKLKEISQGVNHSPSKISRNKGEALIKSERTSQKRIIKSEISLPKLIMKK